MKQYTWEGAFKAIEKLNKNKHEGHENWRLPTIHELFSLVDPTRVKPACGLSDTVSARYWSCNTFDGNTDYAWYVHFGYGYVYVYYKTGDSYVRAVRSGEDDLEWSETL